jgi:hypothetical protein
VAPRLSAIRLTIPHYYDFGDRAPGRDLRKAEAWDDLRLSGSGDFALPRTRSGWEALAELHPEIEARARALDPVLDDLGVGELASYGVGGGLLELWLARIQPGREIVATDYAPRTVALLSELFREGEVRVHDLLEDRPLEADVHLFHRIDTEFDRRSWETIFDRFRERSVILVAGGLIGTKGVLRALGAMPSARRRTRAGYLRTEGALTALWRQTHLGTRMRLHDLDGWLLKPRAG